MTQAAWLRKYRSTLSRDLYVAGDFVPWANVEANLAKRAGGIERLQQAADAGSIDTKGLVALLGNEHVVGVIRWLLHVPSGVGFDSGASLPGDGAVPPAERQEVADELVALGLARLLAPGCAVEDMVRASLVGLDSRRRGHRKKAELKGRLDKICRKAAGVVGGQIGESVRWSQSRTDIPKEFQGRVDGVFLKEGKPFAMVNMAVQAFFGGRQRRVLAETYPELQTELDALPAHLVLIADGEGMRLAPDAVLNKLRDGVAEVLTVKQAQGKALVRAISAAAQSEGLRSGGAKSVWGIVEARLREQGYVNPQDLPLQQDAAVIALARYAEDHAASALTTTTTGGLEWLPEVRFNAIRSASKPGIAIAELLAARIGGVKTKYEADGGLFTITLPRERVLPREVAVAWITNGIDQERIRSLSRAAAPKTSVALLIVDDSNARGHLAALQRRLATTIVALDMPDVWTIVTSRRPRERLASFVLEQADLTKTNPFNYKGATPARMFFGREEELATLVQLLASNSAAVIGGRKIGKTSLLNRTTETLRDAGWGAFQADLQAVSDWRTFRERIAREFDVQLPERFRPDAIDHLVEVLTLRSGGKVVLLFDEVDHLLSWDKDHGEEFAPEAFFRECRAISQRGQAQFVFSGERQIAFRLWDPSSPHWNFCRDVPLRQFRRPQADELLARPLADLGVRLSPKAACLTKAWGATNGHPQLHQQLGSKLVELLNGRDARRRTVLSLRDVQAVVDGPDYLSEVVLTYWGQASPLEKLISVFVCQGLTNLPSLRKELRGVEGGGVDAVTQAVRMLDLYGVIDQEGEAIAMRAPCFRVALQGAFGDLSTLSARLRMELK